MRRSRIPLAVLTGMLLGALLPRLPITVSVNLLIGFVLAGAVMVFLFARIDDEDESLFQQALRAWRERDTGLIIPPRGPRPLRSAPPQTGALLHPRPAQPARAETHAGQVTGLAFSTAGDDQGETAGPTDRANASDSSDETHTERPSEEDVYISAAPSATSGNEGSEPQDETLRQSPDLNRGADEDEDKFQDEFEDEYENVEPDTDYVADEPSTPWKRYALIVLLLLFIPAGAIAGYRLSAAIEEPVRAIFEPEPVDIFANVPESAAALIDIDERVAFLVSAIRNGYQSDVLSFLLDPAHAPVDTKERKLLLVALRAEKRNAEALDFACTYQQEAPDSDAFIDNIHASLRSLGLELGLEAASVEAKRLQASCGYQFSPVWVGIRQALMTLYLAGVPRFRHGYSPSSDDIHYLQDYIASASPEDPYIPVARYFLGEFEPVIAAEGLFRIAHLAEIDSAMMEGTPADKIEKIGRLLREDLGLRADLEGLDVDLDRMHKIYCEMTIGNGIDDFARRRIVAGNAPGSCVTGLFAIYTDRGAVGAPLVVTLLREAGEAAELIEAAEYFFDTRAALLDAGAFHTELVTAGIKDLSPEVRGLIVQQILPTAGAQWPAGRLKRFLDDIAPVYEEEPDWEALLGEAVVERIDIEGLEAGLALIADTAGPDPLLISRAFLADLRPDDQPIEPLSLGSVKSVEVPRVFQMIEIADRVFQKRGMDPDRRNDWRTSAYSDVATAVMETISSRVDDVTDPASASLLVREYTSVRGKLPGAAVRDVLDNAAGKRIFQAFTDGAITAAERVDIALMDTFLNGAKDMKPFAGQLDEEEEAVFSVLLEEAAELRQSSCDDLIRTSAERRVDAPVSYCLDRKPSAEERGRALYVLASIARDNRQWEESEKIMLQFLSEIPDHELIDDIYAELGWVSYRQKKYKTAEKYLNTVIERYPDRNAADNAMYWLGKVYETKGSKSRAARLYSAIAVKEGADRMRTLAWKQMRNGATTIEEFERVRRWTTDLTVDELSENEDERPVHLQTDDQIVSVCGRPVKNMNDVAAVLDRMEPGRDCTVQVRQLYHDGEEETSEFTVPVIRNPRTKIIPPDDL